MEDRGPRRPRPAAARGDAVVQGRGRLVLRLDAPSGLRPVVAVGGTDRQVRSGLGGGAEYQRLARRDVRSVRRDGQLRRPGAVARRPRPRRAHTGRGRAVDARRRPGDDAGRGPRDGSGRVARLRRAGPRLAGSLGQGRGQRCRPPRPGAFVRDGRRRMARVRGLAAAGRAAVAVSRRRGLDRPARHVVVGSARSLRRPQPSPPTPLARCAIPTTATPAASTSAR